MPITVATKPTYPLPGSVRLACTYTTGNRARFWLTEAPPKSKLAEAQGSASRIELGTADSTGVLVVELDWPGQYNITVQEYTFGASSHGGGYGRDPNAVPVETKVGAEVSVNVLVGDRLETRVGCASTGYATFVVHAWGSYFRLTTAAVHGIDSPGFHGWTNDRADSVIRASTVKNLAAAWADAGYTTQVNGLDLLHADIKAKLVAHFNNTGIGAHANPDNTNDTEVEALPDDPATPAGYCRAARTLRNMLVAHMTNNDGTAVGGEYHTNGSGAPNPDWSTCICDVPGGTDMGAAFAAYADVVSVYEAHRLRASVHDFVDNVNTITATIPGLVSLHKGVLDVLRDISPTKSATRSEASHALIHKGGFKSVVK